jgi:WD40 repeat protein
VGFVGVGHSSDITKVRISPGGGHIVSVSQDAAVLVWSFQK